MGIGRIKQAEIATMNITEEVRKSKWAHRRRCRTW
jgi:hypothetical protein